MVYSMLCEFRQGRKLITEHFFELNDMQPGSFPVLDRGSDRPMIIAFEVYKFDLSVIGL